MGVFESDGKRIRIDHLEPPGTGKRAGIVVLHGSAGMGSYWMNRFAPMLSDLGIAVYAPRYFQSTRTLFATRRAIFDGRHFPTWLGVVRDAIAFVAGRPGTDEKRIGLLGFSLGSYLALAAAIDDHHIRAVVELAGGIPPGWEARIAPGMAPVLALHGGADPVVPLSEAYKLERVLTERGVTCELEVFPGSRHWIGGAAHQRLLVRCAAFLKSHFHA